MPASNNCSTAAPWLVRDGKGDRAVGLQPFAKLLPAQGGVLDLEVFDDLTLGIDDDDGVGLTGENPVPQTRGGLINLLLLALRGSSLWRVGVWFGVV
jgi:hypothetical protein